MEVWRKSSVDNSSISRQSLMASSKQLKPSPIAIDTASVTQKMSSSDLGVSAFPERIALPSHPKSDLRQYAFIQTFISMATSVLTSFRTCGLLHMMFEPFFCPSKVF